MLAKAPYIIEYAVKAFILEGDISYLTLLEVMVAAWLPWIYQDEGEGIPFAWRDFGVRGWDYPIYYWVEYAVKRFRIYVYMNEDC